MKRSVESSGRSCSLHTCWVGLARSSYSMNLFVPEALLQATRGTIRLVCMLQRHRIDIDRR
jgi:hypothetical protein